MFLLECGTDSGTDELSNLRESLSYGFEVHYVMTWLVIMLSALCIFLVYNGLTSVNALIRCSDFLI